MPDGLTFDTTRIEEAFALVAQYTAKTLEQEFRSTVKGIVQFAINITPPAMGRKSKEKVAEFDTQALARGKASIDRDLAGLFVPIQIQGHRTITHAFGRPLESPVTVPTVEQHPNVEAIYAERSGRRHGGRMTRGRKQAYYVDAAKLESLKNKLYNHIGHAMGGFSSAAAAVGARMPSFAKGKGGAGAGTLSITPERLHFHFENLVSYIGAIPEMEDRIQSAFDYQANAMLRRVPFMAAAAAKNAGFKVAA